MKKFELLSTQPINGAINIPVFGAMTNNDVRTAVLSSVTRDPLRYSIKQQAEIERYCKSLQNDSVFIDPANSEDCFVLAFGFKNYTRQAVCFACVILFAMFGESIINNLI